VRRYAASSSRAIEAWYAELESESRRVARERAFSLGVVGVGALWTARVFEGDDPVARCGSHPTRKAPEAMMKSALRTPRVTPGSRRTRCQLKIEETKFNVR
jgi:hypothetical protein